jgi:HSP20 family protein
VIDMAILRWDPFGEMLRMQRDVDSIFSRMGLREGRGGQAVGVAWMPKIDVQQKGDDIVVHAELPGVRPDDVDVEVTDGVLTVKGERKADEKREGEGWLVRESCYGAFERSIVLPEGVDPASITADFDNGVLMLHVPKALEAAKPKTTKISLGEPGAQTREIPVEAGEKPSESGEPKAE